ncbi:MAG: periplasmic copper chaperone [Alphaproteobacteria bacterium]|jgi:copper(I)-binding protein|nr:periplasmic copper chaperone [Alphaproteobacteria bacterium]
MKRTLTLIAAVVMLAGIARAEDFSVGSIQIGTPWLRATPRGSSVAAAYLTLTNKGSAPDRLIGGSTSVASRFELHSTVIEDGVAKMRPVEGGLEIKPGQAVELKPGSFHAMLIGLKQPLQQGQRVTGTLVFEHAGKVDIAFTVQSIGQTEAPGAGHGAHSGH